MTSFIQNHAEMSISAGRCYVTDERRKAEMVFVAVIANVIIHPNKKLNSTY